MSATIAYKVQVKLGQAEFSAEGPEETVKEQLGHFFIAATKLPISPQINGNGNDDGNGNHFESSPSHSAATGLSPETVKRLFADDGKIVSVRRLPISEERDADVLFLILLGYLILRDQEKVKASDLLAAAKQSGIRLTRIDQVLDRFDQLVTRGGYKRGSWYCMTNPGQEHAEGIASRIFS
jgi:hypothetical protein